MVRTKAAGGSRGEGAPALSPELEDGRVLTVDERLNAANARIVKKRVPPANEIRVGRFNRHLQKFLGMKGAAPSPNLTKEIAAHFLLEDGAAADQRYLQSWETFGSFFNVAAALGFNSGGQLRNPAGSNLIAVVERISVTLFNQSTIEYSVGVVNADLPVVNTTVGFDGRTRQFGAGLHVSQNPVGSGVAGLGVVGVFQPAAFVVVEMILERDHQFALLPGFGCEIRNLTSNQAILGTFKWRERFLEEGERS